MNTLIAKITSRKFLLALAAFVAALAHGDLTVAGGISALYVAAEAYVDSKAAASDTSVTHIYHTVDAVDNVIAPALPTPAPAVADVVAAITPPATFV